MAGVDTSFQRGDHASRPAPSAGVVFYVCDDHRIVYKADATLTWVDWLDLADFASLKTASIELILDGGGAPIATGIKGDIWIPFAATIVAARALADVSGDIVVDVWADTYANFPPVDADSITAAAPVTITAATKSVDTTLTGWTTAIAAGTILRLNVDSAATITRCTIALDVLRS